MQIRYILVGVDLSHSDWLVGTELTEPNQQAVETALDMARRTGARVTFLAALDLSAHTLHLVEQETTEQNVLTLAREQLSKLAAEASRQGIEAQSHVAIGKPSVELIRQVLRDQHDLLIVGSRNLSGLRRVVIGSTGTKLLRKCPCPVWITKPRTEPRIQRILVATDLTHVGESLIRWGGFLAEKEGAELRVVHALEYPWTGAMRRIQLPQEQVEAYQKAIRSEASSAMARLLACPEIQALPQPPQVDLIEGVADAVILKEIHDHQIDLLVMATVGRSGIQGLLIGNTAERLLPEIQCSVLALKPEDFQSPVRVDGSEES